MDLSFITDLLDAFVTFAENIKTFLQAPAQLVKNLATTDFEGLSSVTEAAVTGSSEAAPTATPQASE